MIVVRPTNVKPGNRYRLIQTYNDGTVVAVEGKVILSHGNYISYQGAGRFVSNSCDTMQCIIYEMPDNG